MVHAQGFGTRAPTNEAEVMEWLGPRGFRTVYPEDLSAAVSFYGQVKTDEEALADGSVPFLGFFLESDRAVPVASVETFRDLMESLEKSATVNILSDGVRRGFAEPSSAAYDPAAASAAWREMLEFLGRHTG